jgi:hypothetical protein
MIKDREREEHMKKYQLLIIIVIYSSGCIYSLHQYKYYDTGEAIIIHDSIGEIIDTEERSQYDLFPGIENFREAHFCKIHGGGCKIDISTELQEYVVISRDPSTIRILQEHISTYRTPSYSRKDFEKKWKILDYDDIGLPITVIEIDYVKRKTWRYISTIGIILPYHFLCKFLSDIFNLSYRSLFDMEMEDLIYYIPLVAGMVVSWRTIGNKLDTDDAIRAIKIGRQMRIKE